MKNEIRELRRISSINKTISYIAGLIVQELKLNSFKRNEREIIYNHEKEIREKIAELDDETLGVIACHLEKVPFGNCYGMSGRRLMIQLVWHVLFPEIVRSLRVNKDGK